MPQRHPARRVGMALRLDALDAVAQSRKRAHACAAPSGGRTVFRK
jgi:hypothetical protein